MQRVDIAAQLKTQYFNQQPKPKDLSLLLYARVQKVAECLECLTARLKTI